MAALLIAITCFDSVSYVPGAGFESALNSYFLPKSIPFRPAPNALKWESPASGVGSGAFAYG